MSETTTKARKLWDKGSSEPVDRDLAEQVEAFTVGNDPEVDAHILVDDCWASLAHAAGLVRAGILTADELDRLREVLLEIIVWHEREGFPIARSQEDCHTAIEQHLTERLGDLGKKIHTGRSRNDQVLTAFRLYSKRRLLSVAGGVHALIEALLIRAEAEASLPMSGTTHTRPAMPTTLGLYWAAFAEALLDDARLLRGAWELNDQCPLGSAAGFGSIVPLDRAYTQELLGFERLQVNALYCQNSRGKIEGAILHALGSIQDTLAKLAGELIRFSGREQGFLKLPEAMTTGSSIMPQKRNPDVLELVRAKAAVVRGALITVQALTSGLPSGYNRDLQLLKEPLVQAFGAVEPSLVMITETVRRAEADETALLASCTREIYAADVALEEATVKGIPFRDAYRVALERLEQVEVDDAYRIDRIAAYRTQGSMGRPGFEAARGEVDRLGGWIDTREAAQTMTFEGLATLRL
jgi:argininosuccinate lyase